MRLHRPATCLAALCMSAAPALADITPEQLWEEISSIYEGTYEEFTHEAPRRDGDVLIVDNIRMGLDGEEAEVVVGIDEMRLRAVAADVVEVTVSETIAIAVNPHDKSAGREMPDTSIDLTQKNLLVTARGEPGDLQITYSADEVRAAMDARDDEGNAQLSMVLNNFGGTVATALNDGLYAFEGNYTASEMIFDANIVEEESATFTLEGVTQNLTLALSGALPLDFFAENPDASLPDAFDAGFGVTGASTQDGMRITYAIESNDTGALTGGAEIGSSQATFAMVPAGLTYDGAVEAIDINTEGDLLPAPVTVTLDAYGIGMAIPALVGEPGQDVRLGFYLRELAASASLWDMIDPNNRLTRDPLTLDVALSAIATPLQNIFSEDAIDNSDDVPFEFQSAMVERLIIRALGAELTGDGAFTFGEASPAFGGFQSMVGTAKARLSGLNSALDQLDRAGLIPADQLMGPRMMLGMIAVPTGDDELSSELEVREDGQVLVNGNRMR